MMGLALALNGYFGRAPLWPVGMFVGLAALLAAAIHFADLEAEWGRRGTDYSSEIRLDLLTGHIAKSLACMEWQFKRRTADMCQQDQQVVGIDQSLLR